MSPPQPHPDHPKIRTDADGTLWLNFGEYGREVELAAFSGDGSRLLTVQEVGVARVWDVATGALLGEIRPTSPLEGSDAGPFTYPFQVFIEGAALNAAGDLALLGLNDGTAGVFSVPDGRRLSVLHDPEQEPARKWGLVRTVRFSPDGTRTLAGFWDGAVGIWDATGEQALDFLRPAEAPEAPKLAAGREGLVSSLDLSADGRYLFVGCADMTPLIWDLQSRRIVFSASEQNEEVIRLHLDGEAVLWATEAGCVWSARPGEAPVKRVSANETWSEAVFAPDGGSLLVRTPDQVKLWRLDGESEVLTPIEPPGRWNDDAMTLGFDPTRRLRFYPASPTTLVVETESGRVHTHCEGPPPTFPAAARVPEFLKERIRQQNPGRFDQAVLSRAGDLLVTRGGSPRVELWAASSGERLGVLEHPENTHSLALSPDGSLLAVSTIHHVAEGRPYEIHVWSVGEQQAIAHLTGHQHFVYQMEFGPGNEWLASVGHDRTVRLWTLKPGAAGPREQVRIRREDLDFRQVRVLSDGRLLVFRRAVLEVHRGDGQAALLIAVADEWRRAWAISADERTIACSGPYQTVCAFSLEDGALVQQYAGPIDRPLRVPGELGPEIQATAGALLWEGPGGPYLHQSDWLRGCATRLSLSPDRRETVVPGREGAALVALDPPFRIAARLPLEGRMRASWIGADGVLLVNSAGQVFTGSRCAREVP
jgi:WD40 repeat protein